MDIQLNFINQSNDLNSSEIVIFQKNVAADFAELAIAWKVIKYCGQGDNHPFSFPMTMQVSAADSWGNYTPQSDAQPGTLFTMSRSGSGDTLAGGGTASSPTEVQVLNGLPTGSIDAKIFKSGSLLASKTSVAPQQMAVFQFKPTIWIGVASQIVQGQVMNSAIISNINTEISLLGVRSADIVMTGGGPGPLSTPFAFQLQNVLLA
jgi:hypothetical protein